MHDYFQQALVHHDKVKTIREDLEKAARSMELIKPALVGMWKVTPVVVFSIPAATSTNQNTRQVPYPPKAKSTLPKDVDTISMTRTKSSPKRTGATTCQDYAKSKCYNYNQLGHLSKNCPAPQ